MHVGRRFRAASASSSDGPRRHRPARAVAAITTALSFLFVSVAVLLSGAPVAAAAPAAPADASPVSLTLACNADASALLGSPLNQPAQQDVSFAVDAPAKVTQGDSYSVTLTPQSVTIPTSEGSDAFAVTVNKVRSFVFRFAIPAGATFSTATVNDDGVGTVGTTKVSESADHSYLEYDVSGPIAGGATVTFPSVTASFTASGAAGTALPVQFTGSASSDGSTKVKGSVPVPAITPPAGMELTANVNSTTLGKTGDVVTKCAEFNGPTTLASTTIVSPKTATTTTASANPTSATTADSVTLSADVTTTGDGTPTGTVQFKDGDTSIGDPVTLDGTGHGELDHTFSTVGAHAITAVYSGDDAFAASTSAAVTVTIGYPATATKTSMSADPTTVPASGTTTLSAQVTAVDPPNEQRQLPIGTVQFTDVTDVDAPVDLGAPVKLSTTGTAAAPVQLADVGDHSIEAVFTPTDTSQFTTSTSAPVTVSVVEGTESSVTLALSDSTGAPLTAATAGQPITATATVTSDDGQPSTGTVLFQDVTDPDNPIVLGAAVPIDATGTAVGTIHLTGVGAAGAPLTHKIEAVYSGGGGYGGATSTPAQSVEVSTSDTSLSLYGTPDPVAAGASTTITVTATTPDKGIPTGSVEVVDATNPVNPVDLGPATLDDSGQGTVTATFTTPGPHSLSLDYAGDAGAGFAASDGTGTITVIAAPVSVQVQAASNPVGVWDLTTLTATVSGNDGLPVDGTVAFWDGLRLIGSAPVVSEAGIAGQGTATWPAGWFESAGNHNLRAVFTPATNSAYLAGAGSTSVTVNAAPTGWPVTGTLSLAAQDHAISPLPAGSILTDNSYDPSTGKLTGRFWSPGVLIHGTNPLADYVLALQFGQDDTATGSVSPDGSVSMDVQLHVQLRTIRLSGALVNGYVPMPSCTFGPIDLHLTGTASPTGLHLGDPSFTIPALPDDADCGSVLVAGVLSVPLKAIIGPLFAPDGNTNAVTMDVPGDFTAPTATSIGGIVIQAPSQLHAGDTVGATATITATSGPGAGLAPTGDVSFVDVTNPSHEVTLGTGTIGPDGSASTSFTMPTAGSRKVVARYAGDGGFAPTQSDPFTIVVGQDPTTLAVAADPSSVGLYDQFTLTATATASPLTATGKVTFTDTTDPGNPVVLGSGNLTADGTYTAYVTLANAGDRTITANYAGDTNHPAASATTSVTVAPAPTGWAASGSVTLNTALGAVTVDFADGTLVTDNSYNSGSGELSGEMWAPPVSALGLLNLRILQDQPGTGQVNPDGTATLDAELNVQLLGLADCTIGPLELHLTGTGSSTGLDLADDAVAIPALAPTACGGLGSTIGGIIGTQPASVSLHVDGDFTPPPTNGAVVNQLYQAILGRSADAGGLAYWTSRLDQGATPQQLAITLAKSSEAARIVVTDLYQTALGRTPDPTGLTYWANLLHTGGVQPDTLLAMLQASSEAYSNAGGNDVDWVNSLYQQLMGRSADSGGLSYWVGRLATGMSRTAVAKALAATPEAVAFAVNGATTLACGNPTTGTGYASLVSAYQASHHNPAVLAGLAAITPCSPPAP